MTLEPRPKATSAEVNEAIDADFTLIRTDDLQDILAMFRDIKGTLEEMRDDEHTWNEVRLKGNIEIYEDELKLTTRIIERYGD